MVNKRCAFIGLALVGILASILACNAPTETPLATTDVTSTSPTEETALPKATDTVSMATSTSRTVTESPAAEVSPTPTETITPTATQAAPKATPTQPSQGEPLVIPDPGFEFVDHQAIPGTGEWEGHLRVQFTGGVPPYEFALENGQPQRENYLYVRWRQCRNAPLTVHVWSADGQEAHKQIWVESPHCPQ